MYQVLAPHGWRQYREGIESDERWPSSVKAHDALVQFSCTNSKKCKKQQIHVLSRADRSCALYT